MTALSILLSCGQIVFVSTICTLIVQMCWNAWSLHSSFNVSFHFLISLFDWKSIEFIAIHIRPTSTYLYLCICRFFMIYIAYDMWIVSKLESKRVSNQIHAWTHASRISRNFDRKQLVSVRISIQIEVNSFWKNE